MSVTVRLAVTEDLRWIEPLMVRAAKDGHFSPPMERQGGLMLMAALQGAELNIMTSRRGVARKVPVIPTVRVAELDGTPSAFLLSWDDAGEREANLSATIKSARRKGCFDALMTAELQALQPGQRIIARCYPKSTWALEALERKHGFTRVSDGNPIELERFG